MQKQKATFKPVVYVAVIPEGEKVWGTNIFIRLNNKLGIVQKAYERSSCPFAKMIPKGRIIKAKYQMGHHLNYA